MILVIGYGNPLRGDDGIGWHIAQRLTRTTDGEKIQILARHQLTPELAEPISRAASVLFIDACLGDAPGRLRYEEVGPAERESGSMTHDASPEALLALAQRLYGRCPPSHVLAVAGVSFGYSDELSPEVSAALPAALARVQEHLFASIM
jgi:hydrogenase maturation protease